MGLACSRDSTSIILPSNERVNNNIKYINKILPSRSRPKSTKGPKTFNYSSFKEWIEVIKRFNRVIVKNVDDTSFIMIKLSNVCAEDDVKTSSENAVMYIYDTVCRGEIGSLDYIRDLVNGHECYICIAYKDQTTGGEGECSVQSKKHGLTVCLMHLESSTEFLKNNSLLENSITKKHRQLEWKLSGSGNVCVVDLICSNNNGGSSLLQYLETCKRSGLSYEAIALHAIPSAYSFYAKLGYIRTNGNGIKYPLWKIGEDTYIYDYDYFKRFRTTPNSISILNEIIAFWHEGRDYGFLLMKPI